MPLDNVSLEMAVGRVKIPMSTNKPGGCNQCKVDDGEPRESQSQSQSQSQKLGALGATRSWE